MIDEILFYADIAIVVLLVISFIFIVLSKKYEERKESISIVLAGLIFLLIVLLINFSGYFFSGIVLSYLDITSRLVFVPLMGICFISFLILLRD